jgi:hypothetical protein
LKCTEVLRTPGKSTHRQDPTLGPRQNLTLETHSGLSECFFSRGVYLEYPAGLGLLRDAQKGLVWGDFGLTTLLGWGFVVILRLLTETSWGLAVEGGLVVQAPSTNPQPLKDKSLRRPCAHNSGIGMELGKLSLLRHIPRKQ